MRAAVQPNFASSANQTDLDRLRSEVFQAIPPLKAAAEPKTVREYLAPMHAWTVDAAVFPTFERYKQIIAGEVEFYYGSDAAATLIAQLEQSACMETGTHLSLPRDRDYASRDVTADNTMVWQGAVLSALSYQAAGHQYHVGPYAGNIPLRNTNGPLYLQLGRTNFLVPFLTGKRDRGIAGLTPALTEDNFQAIEQAVKKSVFDERIKEIRDVLSTIESGDDERIEPWKTFVESDKGYSEKNERTLGFITHVLVNDYGATVYDYGSDLQRFENVKACMMDVASRGQDQGRTITYADQAIVAQKYLMDEIMPESMEQIIWDFSKVTRQLMVEAFRDPNSTFYKIFASTQLRERFIERLGNIQTGWAYNDEKKESPFLVVRSSKGIAKTDKVPFDTMDGVTPEKIADALEADKAIPAIGLEVAFNMAECGVMMHGGMFQCQYAPEYANGMADILADMGLTDRAQMLRAMPFDIATQSLAFAVVEAQDGARLARYSDFVKTEKMTSAQAETVLDMPIKDALTLAAPSLLCFLNGEDSADETLQAAAIEEAKANGGAYVMTVAPRQSEDRQERPRPPR